MQAFYNGTIFTGTVLTQDSALLAEGGQVIDIVAETAIPADAEKINLSGNYIAPAFIDLQLYGGNGKLFSECLTTDSLHATHRYCLEGGCTRFMITMATNAISIFLEGIEMVKKYWQEGGQGLVGLHLEGPYINPVKRGAHIEQYIKKPSIPELKTLLAAGRGVIKMMTLAPEQCDGEIIALLLDSGVIPSAGHTNASYEQAMEGFNTGIPAATHLFNAMSPLQHRAPGMVGAIFDHATAMSSIVADGIHVDFSVLRISKRALGKRLFLITDAVAETSTGPYRHQFVKDRYCLPDGTLSGSALTMMKAVKNCVESAGINLEEALRMASLYPAKLAGLDRQMGRIEKGFAAEFVIFNKNMEVTGMVV